MISTTHSIQKDHKMNAQMLLAVLCKWVSEEEENIKSSLSV